MYSLNNNDTVSVELLLNCSSSTTLVLHNTLTGLILPRTKIEAGTEDGARFIQVKGESGIELMKPDFGLKVFEPI
jgi:hypothetical protein